MKARTLLALTLVTAAPSILFAQPELRPAPKVAMAPPRVEVAPANLLVADVPPAPSVQEEPQVPKAPQAPKAPQPPDAPKAYTATVAPGPPAPPAPPRPLGQMLNVQIEVTLSDSKGSPKTVALTVADGELGQNRTLSDVLLVAPGSYKSFGLNVDARPTIAGNKIRLYLTAEASVPASDAKAGSAANINLRQSQTIILNDGDSVEIARASDPVSERAFTLSVKVKIQR